MSPFSFLFLVANTPWVYALAAALGEHHPTYATRFYDWSNYLRLKPSWSSPPSEYLKRTFRILPPGYVGRLEPFFQPYLQWQVRQWSAILQKASGVVPWTIIPYPYSVSWCLNLSSDRLVYFNLDEYTLYYQDPQRKAKTLTQEAELVERAALTLCLAQFQVDTLRHRYPNKASSIQHFPLGVLDTYINPDPLQAPEPRTVGYIGNLTDRVDWELVYQVAKVCKDITFVFVGGLDDLKGSDQLSTWQTQRAAALSLPNIRYIGKVSQEEVVRYYWSFAINWIPYDVQHPFNQASCPTKIMDSIATGQPIISSNIPECSLYPDWITIFNSIEEAASQLYSKLESTGTPAGHQKRIQQCEFATHQTWYCRAVDLISLLNAL